MPFECFILDLSIFFLFVTFIFGIFFMNMIQGLHDGHRWPCGKKSSLQ